MIPLLLAAGIWACAPVRGGESTSPADPLDRLKQRSADDRWEQVRTGWTQLPDATGLELPASSPAQAPEMTPDEAAALGLPEESAPAAPEEDDWFFGAPENLSALELHRSRRAQAETARGAARDELILTLPEFLDERGDTHEAVFGRHRIAGAWDVAQPAEPALRSPPDYIGLRPITSIQPFRDYDPEGGDPCAHLCPLPGNCPPNNDHLCPDEYALPESGSTERYFAHLDYCWMASNVHHNPLYFENPALERYGHVHYGDWAEPLFSMGRFTAQLVGLPYQMALDSACKRQYALGWYRPGDFAPKKLYQVPLNARAAATSVGVYTGLFLLVP